MKDELILVDEITMTMIGSPNFNEIEKETKIMKIFKFQMPSVKWMPSNVSSVQT